MNSLYLFFLKHFSIYSFELNLSATESALTLIPHYCPSSKHPEKALKVYLSIACGH